MYYYNAKQHNVPSDRAYAAKIIRGLLNNERPENINWAHLNGHGDLVEGLVDIFDEYGSEGARESWENESPDHPELLPYMKPLMHISELKNLPQPSWLVDNVIPTGELMMVFGPPSSGKSFWVLSLALHVAMQAPIVYLAAEGARGYFKRTSAWCKHHNQDVEELQAYFDDEPVQLMDERSVDVFVERIASLAPKLVVIDTLSQCFVGGDENGAADTSQLIAGCQTIQRATGAAVLLVHHSIKSSDNTYRGNSTIEGAIYAMFSVAKKKDSDVIKVTGQKMKDDESGMVQKFKLQQIKLDDDQTSCVVIPMGNPTKASQADGDDTDIDAETEPTLNADQTTALKLVAQAGDKGIRRCDVMRGAEMNDNGTTAVLEHLLNLGFISQVKTRKPYFITEVGQTFLEQGNNPTK